MVRYGTDPADYARRQQASKSPPDFVPGNAEIAAELLVRPGHQRQTRLGRPDQPPVDGVECRFLENAGRLAHAGSLTSRKYSASFGKSTTASPVAASISANTSASREAVSAATTNHMLSLCSRA